MVRIHAAVLAVLLVLAAPFAFAKAIYKLTDRKGNVTYASQVPKGFDGEVLEIQIDPPPSPDTNPPPPPVRTSPASQESAGPGKGDINAQRKAARAKFQERLDLARAKLEAAQKALADGGEIMDDEFQTIQQKSDAGRAKPGTAGPRPNCFQQADANGRRIWVCPTASPGEKYHDRQKSLEDAVKKAEEELAAAEDAYRKGTD